MHLLTLSVQPCLAVCLCAYARGMLGMGILSSLLVCRFQNDGCLHAWSCVMCAVCKMEVSVYKLHVSKCP